MSDPLGELAALKLRVRALELAPKTVIPPAAPPPTVLAQTVNGLTLNSGYTSFGLSVPAGRVVQFFIPIVFRLPGNGQFCVAQILDGAAFVGTDITVSAGATAGATNVTATVAIGGYVFTNVPTLKLYANVNTVVDTFKMTGLAW